MKSIISIFIISFLAFSCTHQNPLEKILNNSEQEIDKVVQNLEEHEVQVLYSQIDRDEYGKIVFTDYGFNVSDSTYFYPASSVKFLIALLALEKLYELQKDGIPVDRKTPFILQNDTLYSSIEKDIIKIFAVSDNPAYNRLFEFLGQDYINHNLSAKNLEGRISHRLSTDSAYVLETKPITFISFQDSTLIHQQTSIVNNPIKRLKLHKITKGTGYMKNDSLVTKPMDFSKKNYLPLSSLHEMMKRIQFPESYLKKEQFDITEQDREFVLKAMRTLPNEVGYDKKEYYDGYVKFFMFGDTKNDIPEHIEIYNKVGYAYGYLTDCAYIKDTKNNIDFILSATIHVNENGIFNDDNYEYYNIGIPFLSALGRSIYNLEIRRNQ